MIASHLRDWARKYRAEGFGALEDKNRRLKAEIELRKKLKAMGKVFLH